MTCHGPADPGLTNPRLVTLHGLKTSSKTQVPVRGEPVYGTSSMGLARAGVTGIRRGVVG